MAIVRIKWDHFASVIKDCTQKVTIKGRIDEDEAKNIMVKLARAVKEEPHIYGTGHQGVENAARMLSEAVLAKIRQDKASALRGALKRDARHEDAMGRGPRGPNGAAPGIRGAADRFLATLIRVHGVAGPNAEDIGKANFDEIWGALDIDLEQKGLTTFARSPEAYPAIIKALVDIKYGRAVFGQAGEVAKLMYNGVQQAADRLNGLGANIRDPLSLLVNVNYSRHMTLRGGRDAPRGLTMADARARWIENLRAWADPATFKGAKVDGKDIDDFEGAERAKLEDDYLGLIFDGRNEGVRSVAGDEEPQFFEGSKTQNLARRISEGWDIVWKDADSVAAYFATYGVNTNALSAFKHTAMHSMKLYGLMDMWGDNPLYNIGRVQQKLINENAASDPDGVAEFQRGLKRHIPTATPGFENVLAHLDGTVLQPLDGPLWQFERAVPPIAVMTQLGSAGIANFFGGVISFPAVERQFLGKQNTFASLARTIGFLLTPGSSRARAHRSGMAFVDGLSLHALDHFSSGEKVLGSLSTMAHITTKVGLVNYINARYRLGAMRHGANYFAEHQHLPFEQLHPQFQHMLGQYGLAEHWSVIQSITPTRDPNGYSYISGRDVLTAQADEPTKRFVSQQLLNFLNDMADATANRAGVRQRAFLRGKTQPGTAGSIVRTSTFMFMSSPLAAAWQTIARTYTQSIGVNKWGGMAIILGLALTTGYMKLAMFSLMNDQEPPTPDSVGDLAKIAMQSLGMSGSLGLIGDGIYNTLLRPGADGLSLGGPVIETASTGAQILAEAIAAMTEGRSYNAWPRLLRLAKGLTPMQNLIWTRTAMNYLFWYHVFEWAKPGWWEQYNRTLKRRTGASTYGYRPGAGVPSLPERLGL